MRAVERIIRPFFSLLCMYSLSVQDPFPVVVVPRELVSIALARIFPSVHMQPNMILTVVTIVTMAATCLLRYFLVFA